jgi:hypothetical protein
MSTPQKSSVGSRRLRYRPPRPCVSTIKVEQNLVGSTQNVSARNRKRQPKDLETYRLELARSLHTEPTHSRAKETAETA